MEDAAQARFARSIGVKFVLQISGLIVLAFAPVDVVQDMMSSSKYSTTGTITSSSVPLNGPLRILRICVYVLELLVL